MLDNDEVMVAKYFKLGMFPFKRMENDMSYLHFACINCNSKIVEIMLKNLLNPNDLDLDFKTPMYYSIKRNDHDAVRILIKYGANTRFEMKKNETIFDHIQDASLEVLKVISFT
jgi:ankyrin repeat protein